MKKSFFIAFAALLSVSALSFAGNTNDVKPEKSGPASTESTDPHIVALVDRYNEIENMDKRDLTASEKRSLRKESSDIKDELKAQDGVVIALSGTAILVIILLLILL